MTSLARLGRVLVIGGTGVFGARLVDAILATTRLQVVVAGRDPARTAAFIASRDPARLDAAVIDTATVSPAELRATGAFAVVDAAGPFQGQDYRLARAAIAAGLHLIDLSDGRAFVGGITVLDAPARAAGVAVLSGASSTPALSNAVLDAVTSGWVQVDDVSIVISPGNRAPRGLSVVQSILSYAGQRVPVFLGGAWTERSGWGMTRSVVIPGLGRRIVSLCETPDLDIVVRRFAVRGSVRFEAGLELATLHFGLAAAALLVRLGVLRSLTPWAGVARRMACWLERFGTDRGGMLIDVRGVDATGARTRTQWSLLAEAGDGPSVPPLPALALLRALWDGRVTWCGAAPCVGVLTLEMIEREIGALRIIRQQRTHCGAATRSPCMSAPACKP